MMSNSRRRPAPARRSLSLERLETRYLLSTAAQGVLLSLSGDLGAPAVPDGMVDSVLLPDAGQLRATFRCEGVEFDAAAGGVVPSADGFVTGGAGGNPSLLSASLRFALPPDADLGSVALSIEGHRQVTLDGAYDVAPAAPAYIDTSSGPLEVWASGALIEDGRNAAVYGADAFFGAGTVSLAGTEQLRGWKYVSVAFAPLQYNPVSGQVLLADRVDVVVTFETDDPADPLLAGDARANARAAGMFVNYDEAAGLYALPGSAPSADPAEGFGDVGDYLIITTSAIQSASSKLDDFVAHKEAMGYGVEVITQSQWGGGTGSAAAANLRGWLQANYAAKGTDFVLLVGDPTTGDGDVPMKATYPSSDGGTVMVPTDYYYADMTSNWDGDSDGRSGEWQDDFSTQPSAELIVGRIPVYDSSVTELDSILQKMIDYDSEYSTSWREKVMLPMGILNYEDESDADGPHPDFERVDNADLGETIESDLTVAFSSYELYEHSGLDHVDTGEYPDDAELTHANVMSAWTGNNYGIVAWACHGTEQQAQRKYWDSDDGDDVPEEHEMEFVVFIQSSDAPSLDDDHPSFVIQATCDNGAPEDEGNLGYAILKSGGIGVITTTEIATYSPVAWQNEEGDIQAAYLGGSRTYAYMLTRLIAENPYTPAAYALNYLREGFTFETWSDAFYGNCLAFNYYGDPSSVIGALGSAPPPVSGAMSAGSDTGVSSSDGITSETQPTFAVTVDRACTVNVDWDGDGTPEGSMGVPDAGTYYVAPSFEFGEGPRTVIFTMDGTANEDTVDLTIDTTPPSVPAAPDLQAASDSGVSSTDNITSDTTPTLDLSGFGSYYRLYRGAAQVSGDYATAGTYTDAALSDATYSYTLTAVDAAGNESAASGALGVTVDTLAPGAPSVPDLQAASDSGASSTDNITNDTTPTLALAGFGSYYQLYRGGSLTGGTYRTSATYTEGALGAGLYSYTARSLDAAGNMSADSGVLNLTVDTAGPTVTAITPSGVVGATVSQLTAGFADSHGLWTSTVTDTSNYVLESAGGDGTFGDGNEVDHSSHISGIVYVAGTATLSLDTALTNETYRLTILGTATVMDVAGNPLNDGANETGTFTVAAGPPSASIALATASDTGISDSDDLTNLVRPSFDVTVDRAGTVRLDWNHDGSFDTTDVVASAGTYTYAASLDLSEGSNTVDLEFEDASAATATDSATVQVDLTRPASPTGIDLRAESDTGESDSDDLTSDNTPTFDLAGAGSYWRILRDAAVAGDAYATGTYFTDSPLADGSYGYEFYNVDEAGNLSAAAAAITVEIDATAPVVYEVTPSGTVTEAVGTITVGLVEAGSMWNSTVTDRSNYGLEESGGDGTFDDGNETDLSARIQGVAWNGTVATITVAPALGGGTYRLTVKGTSTVMDAAGNPLNGGADEQATFTVEGDPPTLSVALLAASDTGYSDSDGITSDNTPSWDVEVNRAGTLTVDWTGDGLADLTQVLGSAGLHKVTLPTLADAGYTVDFTFDDGSQTAEDSAGITVDTVAPSAPPAPDLQAASDTGVSSSDNITKDDTPTFDVASADTYFRVYRGGVQASGDWETAAWTSGVLADAAWSFTATSVDAAGNESGQSLVLNITVDTVAPAQPGAPDLKSGSDTGVSSSDDITADDTPSFSVSSTATYFRFYRDSTSVSGDYESGLSYTAGTQPEGTWTYTIGARDRAGNESLESPGVTVTIDVTAPAAPAAAPDLQAASDTGASDSDDLTNDTTPAFDVASAGPYWRFYRDATRVSASYATGGVYTFGTALADGQFSMTFTSVDVAGNESAASPAAVVTVDTAGPTIVLASPYGNLYQTVAEFTVQYADGHGLDVASITDPSNYRLVCSGGDGHCANGDELDISDRIEDITWDGGTSTATLTLSSPLTDDAYGLTMLGTNTIKDAAGNPLNDGADEAVYLLVDVEASSVTVDLQAGSDSGALDDDNITNIVTPVYDVKVNEPGTIEVDWEDDGTVDLTQELALPGTYQVTPASAFSHGLYPIEVTFTAAGGGGVDVGTDPTMIDLAVPVLTNYWLTDDTGAYWNDQVTNDLAPSVGFAFNDAVYGGPGEIEFQAPDSTVFYADSITGWGTSAVTAHVTTPLTQEGVYTVTLIGTASILDPAGNVLNGGANEQVTFTIDTTGPGAPNAPDLDSGSDTGQSGWDDITADTTPTFNLTGFGTWYHLYRDGVRVSAENATSFTFTDGPLADGTYVYTLKALDEVGNESPASDPLTVTIDTQAPAQPGAPDLASFTDTGISDSDDLTRSTFPYFLVSSTDTYWQFYVDGVLFGGEYNATSAMNTFDQTEGVHVYTIRALDAAGNISTESPGLTVTIDTTGPNVTPAGMNAAVTTDGGQAGVANIGDVVTFTWRSGPAGDNVTDLDYATADLTEFGGPDDATLYDDGTHGDETAGDGTWTTQLLIAPGDADYECHMGINAMDIAGNTVTLYDSPGLDVDNGPVQSFTDGTATVSFYDMAGQPDTPTDDLDVKFGKNPGEVKKVQFGGDQGMGGLGIVIRGATDVGAVKDARKNPADIAFFISDAPVKALQVKSGATGYDLNGMTIGGMALGPDIDSDGQQDDPLAVYIDGPVGKVQAATTVTGDVLVKGAGAKGYATKAVQVKNGGFHGDMVLAGEVGKIQFGGDFGSSLQVAGALKMLDIKNGNAAGDVSTTGDLGKVSVKGGDLTADLDVGGGLKVLQVNAMKDKVTKQLIGGNMTAAEVTVAGELKTVKLSGDLTDGHLDANALAKVIVKGEISGPIPGCFIRAATGSFLVKDATDKLLVDSPEGEWFDGMHAYIG